MPKNLVLCLDGTSNEYGAVNTNVVKLYSVLEDSPDQLLYYQPGIGTIPPAGTWTRLKRRITTTLDLAFAILLDDHVCAAYRFLMRYYEAGDRIYIFGFSRGAYTARVLAAMLFRVGLLDRGNDELVPFAWNMSKRSPKDPVPDSFKKTFGRAVEIHFLGVWDTVSSVGWAYNPQTVPYSKHNPIVRSVRHAVSLDERRAYFRSNLWEKLDGQDADEQWFAGVHCDVGGGYPELESGLSKLAWEWMLQESVLKGLRVDSAAVDDMLGKTGKGVWCKPDVLGPLHKSLSGLWWLVEALPHKHQHQDIHGNWKTELIIPLGRPRTVPASAVMHSSVEARMLADSKYRPENIRDRWPKS